MDGGRPFSWGLWRFMRSWCSAFFGSPAAGGDSEARSSSICLCVCSYITWVYEDNVCWRSPEGLEILIGASVSSISLKRYKYDLGLTEEWMMWDMCSYNLWVASLSVERIKGIVVCSFKALNSTLTVLSSIEWRIRQVYQKWREEEEWRCVSTYTNWQQTSSHKLYMAYYTSIGGKR